MLGELLPCEPEDEAVGMEGLLEPAELGLELELELELEPERDEAGLLGDEGELLPDEPEEALGIDGMPELLEELCCCSSQPPSTKPSNMAMAKGRSWKTLELVGVGIAAVSVFVTDMGIETDTGKVWFSKADPVGYALPSAKPGQLPSALAA